MPRTFVRILKRARRDLEAIPLADRKRLADRIHDLADDPSPRGVDTMRARGLHLRIRVGQYRICYQFREDEIVIVVVTSGARTVEGIEVLAPVSSDPAR